jgi:HisJ family histidinol phosphate phosphatase
MVADHINYLTFEDPAAVNLVRRALKLAAAGDLYGAAETAGVDLSHAALVSEGLKRGMRYSIGAEVDNDPRARPDAQNIVEAMKPDGLIRSVHFLQIEHPVHGAGWHWPFDNPEFSALYETVGTDRVWETYMATLLDAIEKLPGHVVGHFYVPAKFGHWPEPAKLEAYEDQLVAACAARGMAIELNTRFYYRYLDDEEQKGRYLAANLRLLKKAQARGVGIAVGSDANSPKDQGEGFERVLQLLDEAEINELVFPIAGRLARVALRAVREAVEEAPPDERPAASGVAGGEPEPATAASTSAGRVKAARLARARANRTTKPPTRSVDAKPPERIAGAKPPAKPKPQSKAPSSKPPPKAPAKPEPKRAAPRGGTATRPKPAQKATAAAKRKPSRPAKAKPKTQQGRAKLVASRSAPRKGKPGTKPAKKPAPVVRAAAKPKPKPKGAAAPVKHPKRAVAKAPARNLAVKKTAAKKRPPKSRK